LTRGSTISTVLFFLVGCGAVKTSPVNVLQM
jgi:hypothetical protein